MKENYCVTRAGAVSFSADCILAALKLVSGGVFRSKALISDGVHSCADSLTSLMTFLCTLPRKNSEKKKKAEKLTLIFICSVLMVTGVGMFIGAILSFFSGEKTAEPSWYALCVSAFAMAVKETLYHFLKNASEKYSCSVLYAQAWHHRSDALSSVGSFIGIFGSAAGFSYFDGAAGAVISIFIIKTAFDIIRSRKKEL